MPRPPLRRVFALGLGVALAALALTPAAGWPAPRRPGRKAPPPARTTPRADDPAAPVREAYRLDRAFLAAAAGARVAVPWAPPHRARLFTKRLAALLETDLRYSSATGEIGVLDGDPLFDAQEYEDGVFDTLTVEVAERQGERAEVHARFKNYAVRVMRFVVVREDERWAIDDIVTSEPESSLAALLAAPHFCAKGWSGPCRSE